MDETSRPGRNPGALDQILRSRVPDWTTLSREASSVKDGSAPLGFVVHGDASRLASSRGLRAGNAYALRLMPHGLCLHYHPGPLGRFLAFLLTPLLAVLNAFRRIRNGIDSRLAALAARFGKIAALFAIPLAVVAWGINILTSAIGLLVRLPSLLFSPVALAREIVGFLRDLVFGLFIHIVRALVTAVVSQFMTLDGMLKDVSRNHWVRGVALGLLRKDRPAYPVLIDSKSVSELRVATRAGLFGAKRYLVIVEGDPLHDDAGWLVTFVGRNFLPFYWVRTVHMLRLPKGAFGDRLEAAIASHIALPVCPLNGAGKPVSLPRQEPVRGPASGEMMPTARSVTAVP